MTYAEGQPVFVDATGATLSARYLRVSLSRRVFAEDALYHLVELADNGGGFTRGEQIHVLDAVLRPAPEKRTD